MLSGRYVAVATCFVVFAVGVSLAGRLDATGVSMPRARVVTLVSMILAIVSLAV